MDDDKYNKLGRLFQFINNDFSQRNYNYGGFNGNYKTYCIDDVQFPEDTLQLINKLMLINVVDFYEIEYLKSNNYPEKYYNAEVVKKSDTLYGFHYQLPNILFHYIFNQLKDAALQFLSVIESKEFKAEFNCCSMRDKYIFQYPTHMHDQIFKYLDSRIENFYLLHHQFNFLSDISYNDGRTTIYKLKRIEKVIDSLKGFDFKKINL
jgi:hypothetical protein